MLSVLCPADIYLCGDPNEPIVLRADAYETIKANIGSCPVDCMNSAGTSTAGSSFYWQVSAWSDCSSACNGGLQTRDVVCHSAVSGMYVNSILPTFIAATKCISAVVISALAIGALTGCDLCAVNSTIL